MLEKIKENPLDYKGYLEYGKYLENVNLKQAYLTYENALFYCQDELVKIEIQNKLDEITYRQGKVEPEYSTHSEPHSPALRATYSII